MFITDDDKELLPSWLRFVKGIIDSSDLPLNVSREILQQNRIMAKIRSNSVKKVLDKLNTIAKNKNKYFIGIILSLTTRNVELKKGVF